MHQPPGGLLADHTTHDTSPASADARTREGTRPPLLTGVAIVVLIALVALSARGSPVSMALREGYAERVELVALVLLLYAAGTLAAGAITVLVHRRIAAQRADPPPLRRTLVRALPIAAVTLSTLALLAIARVELELSAPPGTLRVEFVPRAEPGDPFGFTDTRNPNVRASEDTARDDPEMLVLAPEHRRSNALARSVAAGLGLLVLALIAAAVWQAYVRYRARRTRKHDAVDVTEAEQAAMHGALVATIDAMLADADPRTAIIGAYARLLDSLDAAGTGRLDHEAPGEHLQRALERVRVRPQPLHELIALFEIARFSTHRLTSGHRELALDALHAAAADIAAAAHDDVLSHTVTAGTADAPRSFGAMR